MECSVCFNKYNTGDRRPKCLPCIHSLCARCVHLMFRDGALKCPQCRVEHKAKNPQTFQDNYALCEELEGLVQAKVKASHVSVNVRRTTAQLFAGRQLDQLVTAGLYAVHRGDEWLSGRVSLDGNHLCVHQLNNTPPPDHTHIIQFSSLLSTVDPSNCLVFMDLKWSSYKQRRVSIKLSPDTAAAQWFLEKTTGQCGGFKDKYFTNVYKQWPGKCVEGPECNEKLALVKGQEEYIQPLVAGTVAWCFNKSNDTYTFSIATRDTQGFTFTLDTAFGQVTEGLEVLQEAVETNYVYKMIIADCGLMLPL